MYTQTTNTTARAVRDECTMPLDLRGPEAPPAEAVTAVTEAVDAGQRQAEDATIAEALAIVARRWGEPGERFNHPDSAKTYARLYFSGLDHEVFVAFWLNVNREVVGVSPLFYGTLDGAAVYPREVAKAALQNNAAAVIFAHNHPSGCGEPSQADRDTTNRLRSALEMIDIRTIDHLVVGRDVSSLAERGWI